MSASPTEYERRLAALTEDILALRERHLGPPGEEDLAHLSKMERWTWGCTALGYATAWIAPNPLSVLLLSTGRFARWTVLSHPIVHKGYDRAEEPGRYGSTVWAVDWRRYLDWLDWMVPAAWAHEHNQMHHYRLGETADPDLVEDAAEWIRAMRVPVALKYLLTFVIAACWKPAYYAPTTWAALYREQERKRTRSRRDESRRNPMRDWTPLTPVGRRVWLRSWLPFVAIHFVLIPAVFLPISLWAAGSVLANNLMAEVLTNLHSFLVIAPNHSGGDCWRFDGKPRGKTEFYLRQIAGSVNYACGTDRLDFFHGWLNYQIEHHLFPEATMLQYRRIQPELKALCARHGVPYIQESVWVRCWRLVQVIVGNETMQRLPEGAPFPLDEPVESEAVAAK
jgi:fatty acid desaturase